jgi:hypothetical protein
MGHPSFSVEIGLLSLQSRFSKMGKKKGTGIFFGNVGLESRPVAAILSPQ